jgi:hypothetical protein
MPTAPATYDANATYRVVLAKPIPFAGRMLRPRDEHEMLGSLLITIIEEHGINAVASADIK